MVAIIINIEDGDGACYSVDRDCYYILRFYPDLLPCAGEDALSDECCSVRFFGLL